jgi:cathepsin C
MIYDEGFEITHGDYKFFAFSKYYPEKEKSHNFKSDCGNTIVGWYNNKRTMERGCYLASKVD